MFKKKELMRGNIAVWYLGIYIFFILGYLFFMSGFASTQSDLRTQYNYTAYGNTSNTTQDFATRLTCGSGYVIVDGALDCLGKYGNFVFALGSVDSGVNDINTFLLFPMSLMAIICVMVLIRG